MHDITMLLVEIRHHNFSRQRLGEIIEEACGLEARMLFDPAYTPPGWVRNCTIMNPGGIVGIGPTHRQTLYEYLIRNREVING